VALIASISSLNTGENGFWAEILTGNEQGNNRRGNRENILTNRCRGSPGLFFKFFRER
jgi:hypothetical protein